MCVHKPVLLNDNHKKLTTNYNDIIQLIYSIDPIAYCKTRNYFNGVVSKLSPYISRGVISTKQVFEITMQRGFKYYEIEQFIKELAWREYFQQVWKAKGNAIDEDIKQPQAKVSNHLIASNLLNASTSINAIDSAIRELYKTGYMHNHARMYVASLACNIAQSHWLQPAKWMYYYLLDADWASNALSWQWVAGSFSNKKYYANQENINKYSISIQHNTFLDCSYEAIETIAIPEQLKTLTDLNLSTNLPTTTSITINEDVPTYVYTFYNLDINWCKEEANKILLLEPSFFAKYPVCSETINFILELANNISAIQVFVGEFNELKENYKHSKIVFKEHPTQQHFIGEEHQRDWMYTNVNGYYPSFFSYYKQVEKYLKYSK